jgi:peroxin-5
VGDALAEGRRLLAAGDLANAILHFEIAVQREPNNAHAWRELGGAQSENEQEPMAIAGIDCRGCSYWQKLSFTALKKAVALNAGDLSALFLLSVAYTNEYMYNHALDALADWLRQHPQYAAFAPSPMQNVHNTASFLDKCVDFVVNKVACE